MLPAQDSLENVAIGNLIALPLQGRALKDGNSAFVDSNWNAYSDQWNALLSKPKLSEEFLENKIRNGHLQQMTLKHPMMKKIGKAMG